MKFVINYQTPEWENMSIVFDGTLSRVVDKIQSIDKEYSRDNTEKIEEFMLSVGTPARHNFVAQFKRASNGKMEMNPVGTNFAVKDFVEDMVSSISRAARVKSYKVDVSQNAIYYMLTITFPKPEDVVRLTDESQATTQYLLNKSEYAWMKPLRPEVPMVTVTNSKGSFRECYMMIILQF